MQQDAAEDIKIPVSQMKLELQLTVILIID